jgi:hypothetical protein
MWLRVGSWQNPGEGGVEQRALALDDVPMLRLVGRGQPLGGAGDEVGDHGIDRDPVAGDEDAGLAGRPEVGVEAAPAHLALERQRGVHLADRAVGADGEQALAGTLDPVADAEALARMAHVEQPLAETLGPVAELRQVAEPAVQPGGDVVAEIERPLEDVEPGLGDHPAAVGHADDQAARAGLAGLQQAHLGEPEVGPAAVETQLAETPLGPPMGDPGRRLGGELVRCVAEKHQIRVLDRHLPRRFLFARCDDAPPSGGAVAAQHARSRPGPQSLARFAALFPFCS